MGEKGERAVSCKSIVKQVPRVAGSVSSETLLLNTPIPHLQFEMTHWLTISTI